MTDWNEAYGDMVRAGRKYLHVPAPEIHKFLYWVNGRMKINTTERVIRAAKSWPPKGVRIHIDEITI